MKFKCKMISCSNKDSVGYRELGKTSLLTVGTIFLFGDIHSSSIKTIDFDYDEKLIKIKTQNTTYTFQEIKDED